jgi:NAD(P)-dependent dehydrogenase (short-subunit alcohol dehydrogenase family)
MVETSRRCTEAGHPGEVMHRIADVADEAQVLAFRDAVGLWRPHIHVLFNNAGVGGGGSILESPRSEWERTFNTCWGGVYLNTRAFLPLLLAAPFGQVVNTSSINGFWASLGPGVSHTAYSAAKFAVKGFTEALITDFRLNAPTLRAAVVMPGHIGTDIAINSGRLHGNDPDAMDSAALATVRTRFAAQGADVSSVTDDDLRALLRLGAEGFRDNAPMSAADAARRILDEVVAGNWRILVGDDAVVLDEIVRADPWSAYEPDFMNTARSRGALGALGE